MRAVATSTRRPVAVDDDRRAELLVRDDPAAELPRQCPPERDPVALDGDVEVEARLAHEDVPDGAAHEVHAVERDADLLDRLEQLTEALEREQPVARRSTGSTGASAAGSPSAREDVPARDDADHLAVAHDGHPTDLRCREQPLHLAERRVLAAGTTPRAMTLFTGAWPRPWPTALSRSSRETTPASSRGDADLDAALAVALAEHHRVRDGLLRIDEPRRARHDRRQPSAAPDDRGRERGEHELSCLRQRAVERGRGRLRMAAAAERRRERGGVELRHAGPDDADHALVHLDEADEARALR